MFPTLITKHLFLQQVMPEDKQFIFEGLSHPQVIPFYGARYDSFEATKAQMDWYEKIYAEETGISWKIVDRDTAEKLGDISIYLYKSEHKKAEIGFWLLPQYWNRGFASEAMRVVVDYCRNERGIHRLEAFVEEGNNASKRVLEKAGFDYEGKMKDCEIKNGKFINLLVYALLL